MRPDLVVLDVMLPGRDGFALIDVIREWGDIGIVLITARDGLPDRLRGLDGGADDYVVKPFELAELVSRVGAVLRRRGRLPQVIQMGDLMLDVDAGVASRDGHQLELTATELRLLQLSRGTARPDRQCRPDPERGVGLRRLRHQPGAGARQRLAAQTRGPRAKDSAHRPRHRLPTATAAVMTAVPTGPPIDPATPTPSLQRRVMLLVVALLAVLLVVLGLTIDVSLGLQARRNLHDRLVAATSRADALAAAHTSPDLLAAQLNGGSVRALRGHRRRRHLR